jgi:hypothetical protein
MVRTIKCFLLDDHARSEPVLTNNPSTIFRHVEFRYKNVLDLLHFIIITERAATITVSNQSPVLWQLLPSLVSRGYVDVNTFASLCSAVSLDLIHCSVRYKLAHYVSGAGSTPIFRWKYTVGSDNRDWD